MLLQVQEEQNEMIQKVQTKLAITSETLMYPYSHYKDVYCTLGIKWSTLKKQPYLPPSR